jgi:ArsR family transcriptional regulator
MVVYADAVSAAAAPVISPRERQIGGCCRAAVEPDLSPAGALELASTFKAIGDPTRLRILDALRKAAPEAICQCELTPLFDLSQQALSKHLKVLCEAGVIARRPRGLWTYYFLTPGGLEELRSWLA